MNTRAEFWSKVDRSDADGCWPWAGGVNAGGRGRVTWNGFELYAYRVAYMLTQGEIPEGWFICHRCDNPICCRPTHLFAGTPRDNSQDAVSKGRAVPPPIHQGETHHKVRVSDAQVREAREAYSSGRLSQADIGAAFGASQVTVGMWLRGETRRAAGGPITAPGKGHWPSRNPPRRAKAASP